MLPRTYTGPASAWPGGCYHWPIRSLRPAIATAALAAAVLAALASPPAALAGASREAYRGPGAWIDVYDGRLLADPQGTVSALRLHGVRTIYVETANFTNPPVAPIVYPVGLAALIDAAHAAGMRVVAWYLPGFKGVRRDLKRSLAAIRLTTIAGGRFDSFALDIESGAVRSIKTRNRRALALSRRLRAAVGRRYALGAIVPDQRSTAVGLPSIWPRFPYRRLRKLYDVFMPMAYSSSRGKGASFVYGYTLANVEWLRAATGDPELGVHVIGGIANRIGAAEDAAVMRAATEEDVLGASFYKARLSDDAEWAALTLGFSP
jgi:hypothetical protein